MKDALKVGVILDGQTVNRWVYQLLEEIIASDYAHIVTVVYADIDQVNPSLKKLPLAYQFHCWLDKFIFQRRAALSQPVNLDQLLHDVPELIFYPRHLRLQVGEWQGELDVLLNFSSLVVRDPKVQLARFGMWRFSIDNQQDEGCVSSCYWEMVNHDPVIDLSLRCTNSDLKNEIVVHRSKLPVNYNSVCVNQHQVYSVGKLVILRLLKGIFNFGPDYLYQQANRYDQSVFMVKHEERLPDSNYQALANILRVLFRYLHLHFTYRNRWRWFLNFRIDGNPFPYLSGAYQSLVPPADRFWADPFVVSGSSKIFVFVEEFIYRAGKGHISVLELNKEGKLLGTEKILEKPYHLSYPFVFEFANNYYMIPETSENETIELYRCVRFPDKWSFVVNLMEGVNAADTTMLFHEGKWWLFTAINQLPEFPDHRELFLFYANHLFATEWTAHPSNPIVTDVRTARPAGKIFRSENRIYRPAQDCAGRYGRAFNLNEITVLNEQEYAEQTVLKCEADWESRLGGTHTFNFDNGVTLIDVYKLYKRFSFYSV